MAGPGAAWLGSARQARLGEARHGKARRGKAWQGRRGWAGQGWARHGRARQGIFMGGIMGAETDTQRFPEAALVRYVPCDDLDDAIDDEGDTLIDARDDADSEGGEQD